MVVGCCGCYKQNCIMSGEENHLQFHSEEEGNLKKEDECIELKDSVGCSGTEVKLEKTADEEESDDSYIEPKKSEMSNSDPMKDNSSIGKSDQENVYEPYKNDDAEQDIRDESKAERKVESPTKGKLKCPSCVNVAKYFGKEENVNHGKVPLSRRVIMKSIIFVLVCLTISFLSLYVIEMKKNKDSDLSETLMELHQCLKQQPDQRKGSRGTQFLIAFIQNLNSTERIILLVSDGNFSMSAKYSGPSSDVKITSSREGNKTIKTLNVHISNVSPYLTIRNDAILLETTDVASVLSIDKDSTLTDSTTIIPTDKLSGHYLVATASSHNYNINSGSRFVITPIINNTFIAIKLSIADNSNIKILNQLYRNGETFTIKLNRLQTFQVVHEADLTGTTVNSSNPVAVFVGNRCSPIGYQGRCSNLMEQAVPVERLDNTYIVPPNMHGHQTLVRMISPYMTKVTYTVGGVVTKTTMLRKKPTEFTIRKNEIAVIEANMPLLVNSFTTGTSNGYGGPFMVTIPGINQYLDEYQVMVPNGFNASFIVIISQNMTSANFRMNGMNIDEEKIIFNSVTLLRKSSYMVVILEVQSGIIEMKTTDKSRFGLIVYGQGPHDGHGFVGNALLEIPHSCM